MNQYILSRYIIQRTAVFVAIVLLAIGGLLLVMGSADEVSRRASETYTPLDAILYQLFLLPTELYEFIGPIVMLGTLIAVGGMGASNELVIIQLVSRSAWGLVLRLILPGLLLLPIVYTVGEWAAPRLEIQAEINRAEKRNYGLPTLSGEWYRDGRWVINADFISPDRNIRGLTIFELDNDNQLVSALFGGRAEPLAGGWNLIEARKIEFLEDSVAHSRHDTLTWAPDNFDADLLGILSQDPDKLTLSQLYQQVRFAAEQNLRQNDSALLFWNRLYLPLEYLGMLFLALGFSFGSYRQRSLGDTAFRALALAIAAQLLIDTLGSVGLVLGLVPWLAALVPPAVFVGLAGWQLKRRL